MLIQALSNKVLVLQHQLVIQPQQLLRLWPQVDSLVQL